jgi:hypothetical protein
MRVAHEEDVMARFLPLISLCALPLAACAATPQQDVPPAPPPPATCDAAPAQSSLGAKATPELGAELLRLTGARQLRWGAPGMGMTMDYRVDRLTVSYDRDMVITAIACG